MRRPGSLIAIAAMLLATPASAHAFLQHASPKAGETLKAPKEVSLQFTEELEPGFSGVEVTDASGNDVRAARVLTSGNSMLVSLKPLWPGSYRVSWHAVSVDTHRTAGAFRFTVKP
jgi:methionine-rich copper-binding protein CopC